MTDAFLIPLQVYGIGFIISLGIALLIKLMMDALKIFSKNSSNK